MVNKELADADSFGTLPAYGYASYSKGQTIAKLWNKIAKQSMKLEQCINGLPNRLRWRWPARGLTVPGIF